MAAEIVLAFVTALLLGGIDLGVVKYRFYAVWLGKARARAAAIGLLCLNGFAGIVGWWFANMISASTIISTGLVPGHTAHDITSRSWWIVRGIGFGALGYAVLRAQIPRITDKAGDTISILGKLQSVILEYLDSSAERCIRGRIEHYEDDQLAQRIRSLLHLQINRDKRLNELQQKKIGSDFRRLIKALRTEQDPDDLDDIRLQLKASCESLIFEYQELPSSIDGPVNQKQIGANTDGANSP